MSAKNVLYILATFTFILIAGAGLYEHVAVVPRWAAAPPRSLSMFQGAFGINPGLFWRSIHPLCLLLFMSALVINWNTNRRKTILAALITYSIILATTFTYFVPELIKITTTPFSDHVDTLLQARASLWEKLSITRLIIVSILAMGLLNCLTKSTINKTL